MVASGRHFLSDTRAFADWVAPTSSSAKADDLCLGFKASAGPGSTAGNDLWPCPSSSALARHPLNYATIADMGMLGLCDVFVVAPAAPFHPAAATHHDQLLSSAEAHPITPLLAAAPYIPDDTRSTKIQLSWQP